MDADDDMMGVGNFDDDDDNDSDILVVTDHTAHVVAAEDINAATGIDIADSGAFTTSMEEEDNAQESFFENEQEEQRTYEEWLDRIETLRSYLSKAAASGDGVTAGLRSTVHELRRARTCFQVAFPFSESMWLAWIADETATQNDASLADASLTMMR